MADLYQHIGEYTPDKLFAGTDIKVMTIGIQLKKGEGLLKRGSVLCKNAEGVYVLTSKSTDHPEAILTDHFDTTDRDITTAFITGHFNKDALIFGEGLDYDDFELHLRALNIFASKIVS